VNQGYSISQTSASPRVRQATPRRCARTLFLGSFLSLLVALPGSAHAQTLTAQAAAPPAPSATAQPLSITLRDAIARAQKLSPTLAAALAQAKVAAGATTQARAANLPNVTGISQYLYTQGNGTVAARFIANNGVHEYIAQADVHQAVSAPLLLQYRRAALLQAVAKDQAAIARRGLLVTVVQAYSNLYGAAGKLKTAQQTLAAAQNFLKITQQRQKNGDAAYADVLKARIQADDAQSAVDNAELMREQARVALALLIFRDVDQPFHLADDPSQVLILPPLAEARAEAAISNPALDAAVKTSQAAHKDLTAARLGFLPSLTFDYYYGIDANQFSTWTTESDGKRIQNLGYSALGSLSVPLFTWGSTYSKVKQARALSDQAQLDLSFARRKAVGDFEQFYGEAQVAQKDLAIRRQALADAIQSRRLTLLQYRAGVATALEVVTAESAVDTESAALYNAKTRYATALASLATLTGKL
jgi:outer membrane protein